MDDCPVDGESDQVMHEIADKYSKEKVENGKSSLKRQQIDHLICKSLKH